MNFKVGDVVYDPETKDKLMCLDPERSLFYDQNFSLEFNDSKNLVLYEDFLALENSKVLETHLSGLIDISIKNSRSDLAKRSMPMMSDLTFKKEFKTLSIKLPRRSGTTNAIMNIADRDDLIVVFNPSLLKGEIKASLIGAQTFYSYAMQNYHFEANRIFFDVKIEPNFKDVPYLAKANLYVFLQGE